METTGCCGGEPLMEQARADMEGRRLERDGRGGASEKVHSTPKACIDLAFLKWWRR